MRNARVHMMARGEKNEEGWGQLQKENIAGRHIVGCPEGNRSG